MERRTVDILRERDLDTLLNVINARAGNVNAYGCQRLTHIDAPYSYNQKRYIQIAGSILNSGLSKDEHNDRVKPNTKFTLHQVLAFQIAKRNPPGIAPNSQQIFEAYFADTSEKEVSHLCKHKDCVSLSHLWIEDGWTNKSRWFCPVVIIINGDLHPACKHIPRCIPSREAIEDAIALWI